MRFRILFSAILVVTVMSGCLSPLQTIAISPFVKNQLQVVERSRNSGKMLSPSQVEALEADPKDIEDSECESFQKSLPQDFVSGFVESGFEKRKVFYYGKAKSEKFTTIFIPGGPALNTHGIHERFKKIDGILFFDPSGTGCSTLYPKSENKETAVRISKYSSRGLAEDILAVTNQIIGAESKFNLLAHSYGGRVAYRVLELIPERISKVITGGGFLVGGESWVKNRTAIQEEVSKKYFEKYPDDVARLELMRIQLASYQAVNKGLIVAGSGIIDSSMYYLSDPSQWETLHLWFKAIIPSGNLVKPQLESFVKYVVFGVAFTEPFAENIINRVDYGETEAHLCRRYVLGFDSKNLTLCNLQRSMKAKWYSLLAEVKRDPFHPELIQTNLEKFQISFDAYGYRDDVFSPVANLEEQKKLMPSKISYIINDGNHDSFFDSDRIQ